MDAPFHSGSNDTISGRVGVPFIFILSFAAPHLHGVLVYVACGFTDKKDSGDVDTSEQIAGINVTSVNDTGDNCSSVSLSPAINENLQQGFIAGVVDTGEQLIAEVIDTDDKHSFGNEK